MKNRRLFFQAIFIFAIIFSLLNAGCSLLGLGSKPEKAAEAKVYTDADGNPLTRFSETPNTYYNSDRKYKRTTRGKLEEDSELNAQAGSTWVMEGQGAYLFTQNKTRKEGDLLNVQVAGAAQKQVETKVSVIRKLLKQLEEEQEKKSNPEPEASSATLAENKSGSDRAPASAASKVASAKKEEKEEPVTLDMVPTRIVERMADGNYRVKGAQPFMIGKREYKVIVTGMIRAEDFNDQTAVSSEKLLDPQYDVVSIRRSQAQ